MRRLIVFVALLAGLVGAADAGARTTVTVNGTEIVIRVPIQLAGLKGRSMRNPLTGERMDDARLADFIARESERFWNEGASGDDEFFGEKPTGGLSKLRYRDCFTIRIEVEVVATAAGLFEGGRRVRLDGYHYMAFDNDPNGRAVVWDPATTDPTEDTPSAYTQSLDGEWTNWVSYFGGGGHELGHLLGLGDDYNDAGPLPGREDTVMDHGGKFDQNIIDRIVGLVRQSGVQLPECWKGTIMQRGEIAHAGCSWTFEGPARVAVAADGSASGSASGVFTDVVGPCTGPIVGRSASLRLSGRKDANRFEISTRGLLFNLRVSGQTAEGSTSEAGIITWTLDLTCETCKEGAG